MSYETWSREELIAKVDHLSRQKEELRQTHMDLVETQQTLLENETRYRTAFECTGTAMLVIEDDMTISMCNNKTEEAFGYTQEETKNGRKWIEFVADEDIPRLVENHVKRRIDQSSAPSEYEFRMKHKDGRVLDIYMTVGLIPDTKKSLISLTDITQRKRMETALRKSEEEYRDLFENANDMIYVHDLRGVITAANSAMLSTLGYEAGDVGAITIYKLVDPEYMPIMTSKIDELTEQNSRSERFEIPFHSKHNKILWIEVRVRAIWKNGAYSAIQGIARDVTDRKMAEEVNLARAQKEAHDARLTVEKLFKELDGTTRFCTLVSRNHSMKKLFKVLPQIAQSDVTVLLLGESGTGKELLARELHNNSPRRSQKFVAINCSALPESLLESELFGYKAGAFTDAKKDKSGKLSYASGGTLFLDEIGDISQAMQVKLLRVLQEKEYQPLGGNEIEPLNARIIAATNKNLPKLVKKGVIREDFYYRIKVVPLNIPPLRERRCDLPPLCEYFIDKYNARYAKSIKEISNEVYEIFLHYDFPGNIRELENIIEHAFIYCDETVISPEHLPKELSGSYIQTRNIQTLTSIKHFEEIEKLYIESVLKEFDGNKLEAAKKLEIDKTTLFRKIKKLGIEARVRL